MYNLDCIALRHRLYKEQVILIYVQNERVCFKPSAAVRLVMITKAVLSLPCGSWALKHTTRVVNSTATLAWEDEARCRGCQSPTSTLLYCSAPKFHLLILSE